LQGNDKETVKFHQQGNTGAVFGSNGFKGWVYDELLPELVAEQKSRLIRPSLSIETVSQAVAQYYNVDLRMLTERCKGKQNQNIPRKVAMYLCQHSTDAPLQKIAELFNLKQYRSASYAAYQVRKLKRTDEHFEQQLQQIIKMLLTE
jgi:chromosomal replication initiation ATPase DnaA